MSNSTNDKIEDFYTREAEEYDAKRWTGPIGSYVYKTYNRLASEAVEPQRGLKFLEIGCGTGRFTAPFSKKVDSLTAIDISQEMLSATRRKLEKEGRPESVNLLEADALRIPLDDKSFDVIFSFNAINHIPGYENVVREAIRLLKPGGLIVLGYPSLYSAYFPYAIFVNLFKKSLRRGVYTQWPSTYRIVNIARESNLDIEKRYGMFHCPPIKTPVISHIIAAGLATMGAICEKGPLRCLASTDIIALRHRS